ncbi:imidazoleglycerol-phosphate dehydratase [Stetteria hydrogenophila]
MRRASIARETLETRVEVWVDLDGSGRVSVETGIGFLDHMVETMLYYAGFDAGVKAVEKRRVDDHHVAEDVALTLGEALRRAAGDRVARFGHAVAPMDECLVLAAVDYSGRPGAFVELPFTREEIGGLALENVAHFISSLASAMRASVHVVTLRAGNNHHLAEAAFKALGMALGQSLRPSGRVVSTKGVLEVGGVGGEEDNPVP